MSIRLWLMSWSKLVEFSLKLWYLWNSSKLYYIQRLKSVRKACIHSSPLVRVSIDITLHGYEVLVSHTLFNLFGAEAQKKLTNRTSSRARTSCLKVDPGPRIDLQATCIFLYFVFLSDYNLLLSWYITIGTRYCMVPGRYCITSNILLFSWTKSC